MKRMSASDQLRVMTYNLRNNSDVPPNSWDERKGLIQELIQRENPDIIGTQEGLYPQVKDMDDLLPNYGWIGLGRDGGSNGEFMTIYYKKSRFDVLEYNHFWLSEKPETMGSISWDSGCTRMATWARLFDKVTKKSFYHLNTHLDHVSEEARIKGAEVIIQKVENFNSKLPIIVTGDFNTVAGLETHQTFINQGEFVDTWEDATERINEELGTFNGFQNPSGGEGRIDWILYRGDVSTESVKIVNDRPDGRFPSDHFPVIADLTNHGSSD